MVKNLPANAGDSSLVCESGRSPEENGNSLQYYCLGSPLDSGAWRLQSIESQSRTQLATKQSNSENYLWVSSAFKVSHIWPLSLLSKCELLTPLNTDFYLFIYLGCDSLCCRPGALLQLQPAGAPLPCGGWASHCGGFSRCRAQAVGHTGFGSCSTGAKKLELPGSRAPRLGSAATVAPGLFAVLHVGSSWTRDRTCVPCIGRWILIHCTIREFLDWL